MTLAERVRINVASITLAVALTKTKLSALGELGNISEEGSYGSSSLPYEKDSAATKNYLSLDRDWSVDIEAGREIYRNGFNRIFRRGERFEPETEIFSSRRIYNVLKKWGRFCGGAEAEAFALATYVVLHDPLDLEYPIHRFGTCDKGAFDIARDVRVILKDLGLPQRAWIAICKSVARLYGYTQESLLNTTSGGVVELYRGLSGEESYSTLRFFESWTYELHIAEDFATRVTKKGVIAQTLVDNKFIIDRAMNGLGITNVLEGEYLVIGEGIKEVTSHSHSLTNTSSSHEEDIHYWLDDEDCFDDSVEVTVTLPHEIDSILLAEEEGDLLTLSKFPKSKILETQELIKDAFDSDVSDW